MPTASTLAIHAQFTGIDFEGSGSAVDHPDQPIQAGLATMSAGAITTNLSTFLACDQEVTRIAFRVHRIDRAQCAGAPRLISLYPVFNQAVRDTVLVSHNASTERRYLRDAFPLFDFNKILWLDTLNLARIAWPHAGDHSLEALVHGVGLETELHQLFPGRSWHDALFDAAGSLILLRYLLNLPEWQAHTVNDLRQASPKAYHRHKIATLAKPIRLPRR